MKRKNCVKKLCIILASLFLWEARGAAVEAFAQEVQDVGETETGTETTGETETGTEATDETEEIGAEEDAGTQDSSQESGTSDSPVEPGGSEGPEEPQEPDTPEVTISDIELTIKRSNYDEKTVVLQWKQVDNAVEYALLRKKDGAWKEVDRVTGTKATVSIAAYGKEVRYKVRSYQMDGQMNGESAAVKVLIPSGLKQLQTTARSKTKVALSWKKTKGANAYQIYVKPEGGKYSLEKTVKKTKTSLSVEYNKSYQLKVLPIFESGAGTIGGSAVAVGFKNCEFVSISHQKYTYDEMCGDIRSLCATYSEYVSYESIGKSEKGREIYNVILGNPKAENTVLVVCALHGREYITTAVCMKQLEYYLMNYNKTVDGKKLSEVFSKCNVHYVMMANPDGVTISQTSNSTWKGNANGVNLNRNFPYSFKVEGSVKDNSYSGKKAASESETKAIVSLTKKLDKTQMLAVVNYHAMGRIVFGSYGGKNTSLRSDISQMYKIARDTTGYGSASDYGGSSNGNYREYLIYGLGIPSVTVEMGSVSCPVPQYQYSTEFNKNKLVVLREASWLANK